MCDDGWDHEDATVVCNQLGFVGSALAVSGSQFGPGLSSQPIWLDDVACVGREEFLNHCPNRGWGNHNCRHYEDAGVICRGTYVCTYKFMYLYMPVICTRNVVAGL